MFQNLTGWHLLIVLVVILLLFGAPKLPGLARSIGQSMRIFRSEVKTMKDENAEAAADDEATDESPEPTKPAAKSTSSTKSSTGKSGTTKPKS